MHQQRIERCNEQMKGSRVDVGLCRETRWIASGVVLAWGLIDPDIVHAHRSRERQAGEVDVSEVRRKSQVSDDVLNVSSSVAGQLLNI